jgi:hypothetical protein
VAYRAFSIAIAGLDAGSRHSTDAGIGQINVSDGLGLLRPTR